MYSREHARAVALDFQGDTAMPQDPLVELKPADLPHVQIVDLIDGAMPLPAAPDLVPGNSSSTATIALGGSVDVFIDTLGDHDWYRVDLLAGVTYTIQTWSMAGGGSPDSFLSIRNLAGTELASDDDSGDSNYSLVAFTPTSNGTYFIDAGSFQNEQTGSYHLTIAQVMTGGDQIGGTIGTAGSITVGGSRDSNIDFVGDHDFYAINLTAGQTYIFRTGGTAPNSLTDTILTLRDASGTQLLTNDDAGEDSFSGIRYTATTTGTFYLDVSAFGSGTGGFNLTAFTTDTPTVWTTDQIANQLTNGYWGGSSHHFNVAPGGTLTFNVQGLTAAGQTLARAALQVWTDVTGINFSEVTSGGQIVYDDNQDGAFANASYSNGITSVANVNVSTQWLTNYGTGMNSYSFQTYLHETGHALGLGHAGNYNGSADYGTDSLYLNDAWATTVMSYFDQTENTYFSGQGFTKEFVLTPMAADGVAVANLYGVNTLTRTGNTTYGFNDTSGSTIYAASGGTLAWSYTIYDNGGTDTLDYSGYSGSQLINLNAETFSSVGGKTGNVTIARGTVIENVIAGGGNETIIGNAADNFIHLGRGGQHDVSGNDGNDTIYVGENLSSNTVSGGNGTDTLIAQGFMGVTISPPRMNGIEVLQLLPANDARYGYGGAAVGYYLTATDGNVAAGATLTIQADTLRSNEVLSFDGSVETDGHFAMTGGAGDDILTGGALSDTFAGGAGRDTFHGGGGDDVINVTGSDYVAGEVYDGGTGTDTLSFFSTGPIDISGATIISIETLFYNSNPLTSTLSLTLAQLAGFNTLSVVTSLTLTTGGSIGFAGKTVSGTFNLAAAGTTFDLTGATLLNGLPVTVNGNGGNDTITGSAGNDTLSGGGGDDVIDTGAGNDTVYGGAGTDRMFSNGGTDTMYGGADDDVYIFDSADDRAMENANEGFDTIKAYVDYSLVGVSNIEQLRVMGTANLNATGNALANNLAGNDGNNILDGGGGGDHMKGLAGNDTYIVRDAGDSVVEQTGAGDDIVKATVSYTLANAATIEVEHLWTNDASATTAINLTGNAFSHDIQGNAGANVLTGGSGADTLQGFGGNDTLFGGGGADIFKFAAGTGQDSVGDFVSGSDRLDLSAFGFANFAAVQAATHDVGGSAVIDLGGGNTVTLTGFVKAQLQSGDVIVSGGGGAAVAAKHVDYERISGKTAVDQDDEVHASWHVGMWIAHDIHTPGVMAGLMPVL